MKILIWFLVAILISSCSSSEVKPLPPGFYAYHLPTGEQIVMECPERYYRMPLELEFPYAVWKGQKYEFLRLYSGYDGGPWLLGKVGPYIVPEKCGGAYAGN